MKDERSVQPVINEKWMRATGCEVLFDVEYWTRPGVAVRDFHFVTQMLYFTNVYESFYKSTFWSLDTTFWYHQIHFFIYSFEEC